MHFKSIELIGFKSFGEQTRIEFDPGITCVVGPNGCGKSNVSDGIRWVLGEQSAKTMRGSSMDDVIFSGTATREPVNFAEVSLTLTDVASQLAIEFDEVVISRRLYRNGDSEYLINKNVVRLRDIQELLRGTGMGINNYSLIEQGKIDQLITSKPEDRRLLFDEVAGITNFKAKKREALRKLELTEGNLQRVGDIMSEVKRQIASCERQAKKAERYKVDFEKVKAFDVREALNDTRRLKMEEEGLDGKANLVLEGVTKTESQLHEVNQLLRESRERLAEVEKDFVDIRMKKTVLESDLKNGEEKKIFFRERIKENEEKKDFLVDELMGVKERVDELSAEVTRLQKAFDSIAGDTEKKEIFLKDSEAQQKQSEEEIREANRHIKEARLNLVETASAMARVQNESTKIHTSLHTLRSRRNRLKVESEKLRDEQVRIHDQVEEVAGEVTKLSLEVRNHAEKKEGLEKSLEEIKHEAHQVRDKFHSLMNEHSSASSKLEVLQDIVERHEGFSQGVRFIIDEVCKSSPHGGIIGALADLVDVEPGFEIALETALEVFAQSIICQTDKDALYAMQKLKTAEKGKATFISLENATSMPRKRTISFEGLNVRPLFEVTRPQPRIVRFYESLVQNVFLAESFEDAVKLSGQHHDLIFVTAKGELCSGGMFIGGFTDAAEESMLFGRESRISELKQRLADLSLEKERLAEKQKMLDQRETQLTVDLREVADELPKLQMKLADVSSRQSHLGKQKQKLDEENVLIESEITENRNDIQEDEDKDMMLNSQTEGLVKKKNIEDESLRESQRVIEEQTALKEKLLVQTAQIRSELHALQDREARLKNDLARGKKAWEAERRSQESKNVENMKLSEEKISMTQQSEALETQGVKTKHELEELIGKNRDVLERRETSIKNVEDLEGQKSTYEKDLIQEQKSHHEQQLRLNEINHKRDRVIERIQTTYQVALEGIDETSLRDVLPEEIDQVRDRLKKAGPVNLVAIDEYEELKKRHEFLTHEQEDLNRAKDDIHKAILKINRTTRERFIDSFTKIQQQFREYYKVLFGGGTADILLLNENDVLESGIDIVARPPGKKLQSITLLSGGEKALTVIAILFAVFKVKPSPFCVLDEIDAPLDDANVQRFAVMLRSFVKESQFIIITHNRRTMALADVMYGVTMQQSGLSRVVSVKFGEGDVGSTDRLNRRVGV
jgi:chromosome segregation protein